MTDRRHFETEDEAIPELYQIFGAPDPKVDSYGWTLYHFVAGILTIAVPYGYKDDEPRLLLRENEGLYWEVPDA